MRRAILGAVVVLVFAAFGLPGASAGPAGPGAAIHIVVLDDSVGDPGAVAAQHARKYGAQVTHVYSHALKGYAASFRGTGASDAAHDSRVSYVELDRPVHADSIVTQTEATWGLDRIDQRAPLPIGTYTYSSTGAGVTAYVIDTGIRITHGEFGSRASVGKDTVGDGQNGNDCNGHGTHVAGTIGGATYGVAKNVNLVAVRVLDCNGSGSWSGVIAGIDYVRVNAVKPAVANMSLGGSASTAVDTAVRNAISSGVSFAVAAGNGNAAGVAQDACKSSPARVAEAMTVGATNSSDVKASWSNYGKCVDWFAPGVGITSAWNNGDTDTISGTSMATPHTAGVAALYLEANPTKTAGQVRTALGNVATKNVVASAGRGSPNVLLFSNPAGLWP